jgi:hypothetical protein
MGLNKELRGQILIFLRDVQAEHPSKMVRGYEIMERFSIDEYSLQSNFKLLKDLGYIKLLSQNEGSQSFIKITEEGLKQIAAYQPD